MAISWFAMGPFIAGGGVSLGVDMTRRGMVGAAMRPPEEVSAGRTFHISPNGDDSADGRSPASAWRTLERAKSVSLLPGDRLLLEGGTALEGMVRLGPKDAGDPARPVVIGSYGWGRARIHSPESGIFVHNTGGVEIRDLILTGHADTAFHNNGGVALFAEIGPGREFSGISIFNLDISGFQNGIEVGSATSRSGFRDVSVANSVLHDNRDSGFSSYGPEFDPESPSYSHSIIAISDTTARDNKGDPDEQSRNTGSGIILGSVRNARVQRSQAYRNGSESRAPQGGFGIWAYDSDDVLIQHNVSCFNRTQHADGGGFDLDQNVTASVVQHNLSYGNDGPGFMMFSDQPRNCFGNNTFRFNVSVDDARRNSFYGALTLMGNVQRVNVFNNTVLVLQRSGPESPVVYLALPENYAPAYIGLHNNVFASHSSGALVHMPVGATPADAVFAGNSYFSSAGPAFDWDGAQYDSLGSWRAATGQEERANHPTGIEGDPELLNAHTPTRVVPAAEVEDFTAIKPVRDSPLIGNGLPLGEYFGIDTGGRDYFGEPIADRASIGAG
ncbi:right-handed parallel beta-helix repeat-containing protein [Saccharopolyspora karakumensis]|nr:right-handed parallel beta-helix repeat-containing protein [Saccharopolyspora karakumensis]